MTSPEPNARGPLCVDLDGTLIHTDLLIESALALLQKNPLYLFAMLTWLCSGRARLKREIASRVSVDATTLPYNQALLEWISRHREGRSLVLVTASDARLAAPVAKHLGIFDEVIASDGNVNQAGSNKARTLVERFGEHGFDYAGNAHVDLKVWAHAKRAVVVNAGKKLAVAASTITEVQAHIPGLRPSLRVVLKALRVHQWIKNLLIFLPLLAAHRLFDKDAVLRSLGAFVCFGVCASGVYLLNDLLDLKADRAHPRKRKRPFAAGTLSLQTGIVLTPLLTLAAFMGAGFIGPIFALVLLSYFVLTLGYSFKLKRVPMLDVVVLAGLYTVRIIAGTAAVPAPPSFWLLAFSMFIFLSLAILKRYTELIAMRSEGKSSASGRGYDVDDAHLLQALGAASGYLSVLVLALYINSPASLALYTHSTVLWLLCPILLYWISRAWLVAHRGIMHDDPVVFAVTDRTSQILLVMVALVVFGAL